MPGPLDNQRHELFAQAIARGETANAAYAAAGYVPNDQNAGRLAKKAAVIARVKELQERAAYRTGLTVGTATEALMRLAQKAETLGTASGFGQARAAWTSACKLNGLGPQKAERVIQTPEERRALVAALEAEREALAAKTREGGRARAH